jgi:hypothetical protein
MVVGLRPITMQWTGNSALRSGRCASILKAELPVSAGVGPDKKEELPR